MRLDTVEKRWRTISAVGAIVVSIATAIYRPPPIEQATSFVALGTFLSSVTSGLLYVAMRVWSSRRYLGPWIVAAVVGAAGAVWSHNYYGILWDTRVATFQGEQAVIGDVYTREGAAWAATHGNNPDDLLFDFKGIVTNAWTPQSVDRTKQRMRMSYYSVFPLIALGLLSTVHVVYLSQKRNTA